jgi:hypothetical protein
MQSIGWSENDFAMLSRGRTFDREIFGPDKLASFLSYCPPLRLDGCHYGSIQLQCMILDKSMLTALSAILITLLSWMPFGESLLKAQGITSFTQGLCSGNVLVVGRPCAIRRVSTFFQQYKSIAIKPELLFKGQPKRSNVYRLHCESLKAATLNENRQQGPAEHPIPQRLTALRPKERRFLGLSSYLPNISTG